MPEKLIYNVASLAIRLGLSKSRVIQAALRAGEDPHNFGGRGVRSRFMWTMDQADRIEAYRNALPRNKKRSKITTEEKIRNIIVEQLAVNPESVTPDATMDSMGADSLDLAELFLEIEKQFATDFTEEEWDRLLVPEGTVADLVQAVDKKVQ